MSAFAALVAAAAAVLSVAAVAVTGPDRSLAARVGVAPSSESGRKLRGLLAAVGALRAMRASTASGALSYRLELSGWSLSADEVLGWKALGAALGLALGLVGPSPGPLISPVLALAGLRMPDVLMGRAAKRRSRAIDAEVPQLLDLLAAGSSAGLAAPLALQKAAEAVRGPLAEELGSSLRAVDLGRRWRDELAALSGKLDSPDLRRTVAALTRTEALGTSLSDSVTQLAFQVRASRAAATAEKARKAPVKMLFPLVFLVLPAFLLLTVVPVLLSTLRSIR